MRLRPSTLAVFGAMVLAVVVTGAAPPNGTANGEWRHYSGDNGATKYSPLAQIDAGNGLIVIAGLLVGVGTRYGAGCTSGHGVCGLSRLSPRSIVATLAFMAAGFAVVFVMRYVLA